MEIRGILAGDGFARGKDFFKRAGTWRYWRFYSDSHSDWRQTNSAKSHKTIDSIYYNQDGGRGGIRTHGSLATTSDFESDAFNHSATLPTDYVHALSALLKFADAFLILQFDTVRAKDGISSLKKLWLKTP